MLGPGHWEWHSVTRSREGSPRLNRSCRRRQSQKICGFFMLTENLHVSVCPQKVLAQHLFFELPLTCKNPSGFLSHEHKLLCNNSLSNSMCVLIDYIDVCLYDFMTFKCECVWLESYSLDCHHVKLFTSLSFPTSDVILGKFMTFLSFLSTPEGIPWSHWTNTMTSYCLELGSFRCIYLDSDWERDQEVDQTLEMRLNTGSKQLLTGKVEREVCKACVTVRTHMHRFMISRKILLVIKEMCATENDGAAASKFACVGKNLQGVGITACLDDLYTTAWSWVPRRLRWQYSEGILF